MSLTPRRLWVPVPPRHLLPPSINIYVSFIRDSKMPQTVLMISENRQMSLGVVILPPAICVKSLCETPARRRQQSHLMREASRPAGPPSPHPPSHPTISGPAHERQLTFHGFCCFLSRVQSKPGLLGAKEAFAMRGMCKLSPPPTAKAACSLCFTRRSDRL